MDTSLYLSSLQFSSTYVAGNIPTVPRSSPSHQPSSCLSWMLMTSPALMLSSSYMLAVQSYNARQVPMLGASRPVDPAELKDSKGFFFYFFLFIYVSSYSKKSVERGYFSLQNKNCLTKKSSTGIEPEVTALRSSFDCSVIKQMRYLI